MLQDYYTRLQDLQKEKNNFTKMKYKSNAKDALGKQENKYHKYILGQITYKNKLDSLFLLHNAFQNIIRRQIKDSFNQILKKSQKRLSISSKDISQLKNQISFSTINTKSTKSVSDKEKQSDMRIWIKNIHSASCKLIFKLLQSNMNQNIKHSFKQIENYSLKVFKINNFIHILSNKNIQNEKYFFENLQRKNLSNPLAEDRIIQTKQNPQNSFIFSLNQFSQIIPYTIMQEDEQNTMSNAKNIEQIDDKFKLLTSSKHIKASNKKNVDFQLLSQNFQKLKEEILIMKNILNEKNKQIKIKDEQIYKIKKDYEKKIEKLYDELSQKIQKQFNKDSRISSNNISRMMRSKQQNNESYLIQMQQMLIGDRHHKNSQQNVNDQLIEKYMKQSFEMREKMDMARQMCQQFEFDSKTQEGMIMIQIIKLLTPEQRLNVYVD